MTKRRFSFDKHKDTGQKLKELRETLLALSVEIANSYPRTYKTCRYANKAVNAVNELRCELDSQLFRDCPDEVAGDGWQGVYYGRPQ
jgi:2-methylcitrate dehydratase PrpD